jgi:hypothetical protein
MSITRAERGASLVGVALIIDLRMSGFCVCRVMSSLLTSAAASTAAAIFSSSERSQAGKASPAFFQAISSTPFPTLGSNLAKELSEMSNIEPEKREVSELAFASNAMRQRIAPPAIGSVKHRINRAAAALRWSASRTRDVWYADPRVSIKPRELRKIEEIAGVVYGRKELAEIDALISRAESLLAGSDPAFHRPFIAALRALAGRPDSTGTEGE